MTPNAVEVAGAAIAVADHLADELEEALGDHRLSRPSFLVLDALDRAEDHTLGQRELIDRVRRTSGSLSVRLTRLERVGLVERRPDPENRRSQTVTLTDRGDASSSARRVPDYERRCERLVAALPGGAGGDGGRRSTRVAGVLRARRVDRSAPRRRGRDRGRREADAGRGRPSRRGRSARGQGRAAGAAQAAGLKRGDLIRTADGTAVDSLGDLDRAVHSSAGTITLGLLRGVEEHDVTVQLH